MTLRSDVTGRDFGPIARDLALALDRYFRDDDEELAGEALRITSATNSSLVEQRARRLLDLYFAVSGRSTLSGLRVLDLGCGFGALSVFFAFLGADVTAVDRNSRRMTVGRSVAEANGLAVQFQRQRLESIQQPDGAFDLGIMNNSLCYLVAEELRASALGHARRVLRHGGALLIREPNRAHPLDPFTKLPGLTLLPPATAVAAAARLGRHRSLVRLRSGAALRRELRRSGFDRVTSTARPHATCLAPLRPLARYQHVLGWNP